jgi:hypothetical protein
VFKPSSGDSTTAFQITCNNGVLTSTGTCVSSGGGHGGSGGSTSLLTPTEKIAIIVSSILGLIIGIAFTFYQWRKSAKKEKEGKQMGSI